VAPLIDEVSVRGRVDAEARRERQERRERQIHERERAARDLLAPRRVTIEDSRKLGRLFELGLARLAVPLFPGDALESRLRDASFVYPVGLSEVGTRETAFARPASPAAERRGARGRGRRSPGAGRCERRDRAPCGIADDP